MTQTEKILKHLRRGRKLTVLSALKLYGIYALSQRVGEIRKSGVDVDRNTITLRNGKHVTEYSI